jgi:hypothetical protein
VSKVLILVEGQTEETFVRDVLGPHLNGLGIYPIGKSVTTKRVKQGPHFKGGIVSYGKTKNDAVRLLSDTSAILVTTLIDFYGLPTDFPGYKTLPSGSCYQRVAHLEDSFRQDINHPKFLPYFALHEFEAMLFVSPTDTAQVFPDENVSSKLQSIKAEFASPEEINENPNSAPSKRLKNLLPQYHKPLHGPIITANIGLDRIRQECPYFNGWLTKLESLGAGISNSLSL